MVSPNAPTTSQPTEPRSSVDPNEDPLSTAISVTSDEVPLISRQLTHPETGISDDPTLYYSFKRRGTGRRRSTFTPRIHHRATSGAGPHGNRPTIVTQGHSNHGTGVVGGIEGALRTPRSIGRGGYFPHRVTGGGHTMGPFGRWLPRHLLRRRFSTQISGTGGTSRQVVYDDFTTIDWAHDMAAAQQQQRALEQHISGWGILALAFNAAQSWIVVSVVGISLGFLASFIDISYEWLSDYRQGYCKTGFYLNQRYCCWEEKSYDTCTDWVPWSIHLGLTLTVGSWMYHYLIYLTSGILLAGASSLLVVRFAPYAASSGISEIKTILSGFIIRQFLGFRTLTVKVIGTILAVASGLSIGKEGALVHIASCCGNIVSRLFSKFRYNEAKRREILSAASAAGISVAFGAPIGGVLFSLEEVSYYFPSKTMWRSFFCAMVASVVLKFTNPFRTGKLVAFQVTYDRVWHGFELVFFILLGICGGLLGTLLIRLNLRMATYRQKPWFRTHPILEVIILAGITSLVSFPNILMRVDTVELVSNLFTECEDKGYEGICDPSAIGRTLFLLMLTASLKTLFSGITYGVTVPAGILMPSMAIGACVGRAVGILVQLAHRYAPAAVFFQTCPTEGPCVTPGVYALVGAAATLAGVTRMTVTTVVVMFELTGALIYVLPIMLAVTVSKWVGDAFGKDGIFDCLIKFNGYPYLGPKVEYGASLRAQNVMTRAQDLVVLSPTASVNTLDGLGEFLEYTDYKGFPVVKSLDSMTLLGYISRTELQFALDQANESEQYTGNTIAYFGGTQGPLEQPLVNTHYVDFRPWMDQTPLTMSPMTPMHLVIEAFKQLGLRYLLITQCGQLTGLITKKDILRHLAVVQHTRGHQPPPSHVDWPARLWPERTHDTFPTTPLDVEPLWQPLFSRGSQSP
ncbi:hypothetical protein IWQ61_004819 [Dispira simplex]|nr:hypothetical protein IWQ61_004819 [Dispira simplex]